MQHLVQRRWYSYQLGEHRRGLPASPSKHEYKHEYYHVFQRYRNVSLAPVYFPSSHNRSSFTETLGGHSFLSSTIHHPPSRHFLKQRPLFHQCAGLARRRTSWHLVGTTEDRSSSLVPCTCTIIHPSSSLSALLRWWWRSRALEKETKYVSGCPTRSGW